jgi:aminotransferase
VELNSGFREKLFRKRKENAMEDPKYYLSERAGHTSQSEIRSMTFECGKVNGINLAQGIADLSVPDSVKRNAQQAIDLGQNVYTSYMGTDAIRSAISEKLKYYNGIDADPNKHIVATSGATGAFYIACLALLNPEDEFIVFQPYYGYHINTLKMIGIKPVYADLTPPSWSFSIADLEKAVTPKTRAILINTPANPCGKVFSKPELDAIADFSIHHDLIVFTDEIYEYFIYEGKQHVSPGAIEKIKDRTVTISGFSKIFYITGWRIGYLACNETWAAAAGQFNDLVYICPPSPLQAGVAGGLSEIGEAYYEKTRSSYENKRDMICAALDAVGLTPFIPEGAYYVLADTTSVFGKTAYDKAMHILKKTGVACVPGNAFYENGGTGLVRFCFAKEDHIIEKACRQIRDAGKYL